MVSANLVNYLLTSCVLLLYLVLSDMEFGNFALLPVVMLTQVALCLGMALIISAANVFLRDTEHALSIITLAWFFLSPIFYTMDMQLRFFGNSELHWLPFLNPMSGLLCSYRAVYMSDFPVELSQVAISFGMCWLILFAGIITFQWLQHRFADEL